MKKVISAMLLLCTITMATAQNNSITSIAIGSEIPKAATKLKSVNGKEIALNNVKTGKGLLVMFSCNTCPYVIKAQNRTKEMISYATRRGLGMIIINSNEAQRDEDDSYTAMKEYAKREGYQVPYVVDAKSELANAFGATRTPEVFLFNGNGKLVYKGAMEDNPSNPSESKQIFLQAAIDNMIADKPIDPNATKSIGCSIKRL